jgi:hypothetical protein
MDHDRGIEIPLQAQGRPIICRAGRIIVLPRIQSHDRGPERLEKALRRWSIRDNTYPYRVATCRSPVDDRFQESYLTGGIHPGVWDFYVGRVGDKERGLSYGSVAASDRIVAWG